MIRSELDRCRKILNRMSTQAGQTVGEVIQRTSWARVWREVVDALANAQRVRLQTTVDLDSSYVQVPLAGFAQAIRGIIQNGLDASAPDRGVTVELSRSRDTWTLSIKDQGSGMSEATLKRVSEPFFTTKPAGKGTGLGVFLARSLVQRLGGDLHITSRLGVGTTVSLVLPQATQVEWDAS